MFNWENASTIVGVILNGLLWTVVISVTSIIIGYFIGLLTGFARARQIHILKTVSTFYVWLIRSTPILVQALYIYFVLPKMIGVSLSHEAAGILCVSLNAGAYISEIVRGAILEVPKGQWEAGLSLGMTKLQVVFKLILPMAFRSMLPALGNQFIITVKDTSILTIIGVAEMTYQAGQYASSTFEFVESYTILAVFYLVLISGLTVLINICEQRMGVNAK
ncbi:polar amino acid ABC transporter [Megasphaera cerevisiae DSM 20462]|jgi:glutamine transport system permease protein|uniref:Polar amino acid ABC transporter n=1 Tax=Megasphaera cerevisiae DSM 20462 TaxID=1122219 RepID=A0A0J6WXS7_9FIRM|nr:amino acid ABC transporter permease [Megasphaera cerevisiae]KMO86647.1 polar amino acid ABC transporter [Megasphaera cerevisiae DSM 20462]MCI1750450.1 amino acid ABC transporter permease [Megasphaera cerevisiae]OKY53011.1 polar amino acid ABC transporter [Megasphaera cerevisiae]SJZ88455.1 glutamine transport system permease protein [Megasphaera cerevisiae DSM 20462]